MSNPVHPRTGGGEGGRTGSSFTGTKTVKLGGVSTTFAVVGSSKINTVVPNGILPGFYHWSVTNGVGTGVSFQYLRVF